MSEQAAYALLPPGAVWSSSFGNPGEGGFSEYYRTSEGRRFRVSNGPWNAVPLVWSCSGDMATQSISVHIAAAKAFAAVLVANGLDAVVGSRLD